jgi:hypothetical protein
MTTAAVAIIGLAARRASPNQLIDNRLYTPVQAVDGRTVLLALPHSRTIFFAVPAA